MSNQSISFTGLRLLVVDDDADTRTLLTFLFELDGAEVITAASTEEALKIIDLLQKSFVVD